MAKVNYFFMKKVFLFLIAIFAIVINIHGQWTSPGNGTIYTFPDLVTVT